MLFPKNVAKLGEELNASVEYFVENNILSQSTVQPLLYKVQYAAEKSCKDDENWESSRCHQRGGSCDEQNSSKCPE